MAKRMALILCAGQGKRMGTDVKKPYLEVCGRPLLTYTLDVFQSDPMVDGIVLVVNEADCGHCQVEIVQKYDFTKICAVVPGGLERQDSVLQGLRAIGEETEWIIVHDGARPLINPETIHKAIAVAERKGAAVVAVRAKDTIKAVRPDLSVEETLPRHTLWQAQTPQVFRRGEILEAYETAIAKGWIATDDASLMERMGHEVYIVEGEYSNIKITTPEDLLFFSMLLKMRCE